MTEEQTPEDVEEKLCKGCDHGCDECTPKGEAE